MTTLPPTRRRRRQVIALLALALLTAGPASLITWLQSSAGSALLREKVLAAARDAIDGRVELASIRLDGETLHLENLRLFTPEGELVAELASLDATVSLKSLAARRLELTHLHLERATLHLTTDQRGLNLTRAIHAKTPGDGGPLPDWTVALRDVTLHAGAVDAQLGGQRYSLEGLEAQGELDTALRRLTELTLTLKTSARATAPLDAPLALTLSAATGRLTAQASLADSALNGSASFDGALRLDSLRLTPSVVRPFVPDWPLVVPVVAQGTVDATHLALTLKAGTAELTATSTHGLDPLRLEAFELQGASLDLEQLIDAPRPARLDFKASGSLTDLTEDQLTGSLALDATWDSAQRTRLLTLHAAAKAEHGQVRLEPLHLATPGASVEVRGAASRRRLDLRGTLQANDLSAIPGTARAFAGLELPTLAGAGRLDVTVSGAASHPSVRAKGQLGGLRLGSASTEHLDVELDLPDVLRPLDTDAHLHARRVDVAGRAFDEVDLNLETHGRQVDLVLATRGLGDLTMRLGGELDPNAQGLQLERCEATSSTSRWALDQPTHLTWPPGRFTLEPLSLRDGTQQLLVEAQQRGPVLTGSLHAENLDLARLPRVLASPTLGLGGVVSLDVATKGRWAHPEVDFSFAWARGTVAGLTDMDLRAAGTWRAERLIAHLGGSTAQGNATADLDVPILAIRDGRDEPLRLKANVSGVELSRLETLLGHPLAADGVASLTLEADGSAASPHASCVLSSPALELSFDDHRVTVTDFKLGAETDQRGPLKATLSLHGLEGQLEASVLTPFTIQSLAQHLPTVEELKETTLSTQLLLSHLDLHAVEAAGLSTSEGLSGFLSVKAALSGQPKAPTGAIIVDLTDGAVAALKGLQAHLQLTATDHDTAMELSSRLVDSPLLVAQARVAAPLEPFAEQRALGARAISGQVSLLPLGIAQAFDPVEGEQPPTGRLSGTLSFAGTLDEPELHVRASLDGLKFDKASLGAVRLDVAGDSQRQRVELNLEGAGDLSVKGSLGLPLSLGRVGLASAWRAAPLHLGLDGTRLDLAFLSGIDPLVRQIGGALTVKGTVEGTLTSPRWQGTAQWEKGRLSLSGYGEYRDIDLVVSASNELIEVSHLELKAGAGSASLRGRLTRSGEGLYSLHAEGTTDKLPLINDDQLLATTSMKLAVTGDITPTLIDLTAIDLPRVDVELPEIKRKDLQDLNRPKDIVVVRGGARATRRLKRSLEAAAAGNAPPPEQTFRAIINAPRNIWVRSSDVNLELGLSEGFRVERTNTTQVLGEATVLRGTLSVIGRKFTVQEGAQLKFAGPPTQPWVNLAALHTNDAEKIKVTVSVTGRGSDVTLKPTSEPPLPESDIYALLATGRRELRRGSGASFTADDALSVVGQLATSQLKSMLAKKLPIDVLNFEASDNFNRLKFDVGKYLSDSVYLGVSAQTGANPSRGENPWAARLEYQISRAWSLEASAGTAPAAGADVVWSVDF